MDSFRAGKCAEGVSEVKKKTDLEYYMTVTFRGGLFVF